MIRDYYFLICRNTDTKILTSDLKNVYRERAERLRELNIKVVFITLSLIFLSNTHSSGLRYCQKSNNIKSNKVNPAEKSYLSTA